jgi:hypothetical protein
MDILKAENLVNGKNMYGEDISTVQSPKINYDHYRKLHFEYNLANDSDIDRLKTLINGSGKTKHIERNPQLLYAPDQNILVDIVEPLIENYNKSTTFLRNIEEIHIQQPDVDIPQQDKDLLDRNVCPSCEYTNESRDNFRKHLKNQTSPNHDDRTKMNKYLTYIKPRERNQNNPQYQCALPICDPIYAQSSCTHTPVYKPSVRKPQQAKAT